MHGSTRQGCNERARRAQRKLENRTVADLLLTADCSLLTAHCLLLTTYCLLLTTYPREESLGLPPVGEPVAVQVKVDVEPEVVSGK